MNVCSQLDWKRCVAVHLWFMLPPTASVADALATYEAAFQVRGGLLQVVQLLLVVSQLWWSSSSSASAPPVCVLQGSTDAGRYACAPLPPYLEGEEPDEEEEESRQPLYDLCFHLLKLYSDR